MMTLPEFLLARIAEDEEEARQYQSRQGDVYEAAGWWDCDRVLAECEAKRRIVEHHHVECGGHPGAWMPHGDYGPGYCWREDEGNSTLLYLASVYVDHPDYRDEWRP